MQPGAQLFIEEIRLQPGHEWSVATGPWHFTRVQSGAAYWMGNRARALAERELIVAGPKIRGAIRASQIGEVTIHTFDFAPALFSGLLSLTERHSFETAAENDFAEAQFIPSTHPAVRQLDEIIAQTERRQSLVVRAELLVIVLSIFTGETARPRFLEPRCTSAEHRFHQLVSTMPDAEFMAHSPEHLARMCDCSPRHFSRLFQQHFGTSARERQSELRLLKARQLLSETDGRIALVALDCGFRNVSLFNAMFKARFGVTPSAWRQAQRANGFRDVAVTVLVFVATLASNVT